MVVIKGMDMPSCCAECPIVYKDDVDYRICPIIGKNIEYENPNEIRSDCPLIEIITCKDCRHNYENNCDMYGCKVIDEYFCAGAERKEK